MQRGMSIYICIIVAYLSKAALKNRKTRPWDLKRELLWAKSNPWSYVSQN